MTDRLGGYWLGARLDGGGHVIVREAYDESGTRHALGVPCLADAEARARLATAASAAGRVRSLSVARLTVACLDGEPPYLVSEYIPGPTLRQVVDTHGPYAGDALYRLATAVATALAAAHEAGAVHGSLTPDKVVLGTEGPRLVGLGWCLPREPDAHGRPEAEPWGPAADVRAWGRLLIFAAYGPDERSGHGERLDRPLRGLVAAALHRDPERRPSAHQLLLSLLDAPQSQQGRLLPPEPVSDPPLGARAETVYAQLSPAQQDLVPDVFLRLVDLDSDGSDTVVTASRADLVAGRATDEVTSIDGVLEAYGTAGLLSCHPGTDGPLAITYAGLLRAWPRLREWLDGERDGLAVHRELARAARRWEAGGRREAALFQGPPLDRALAWAAGGRRRVTLSAGEQTFLDAGLARVRRRSRRRWTVMAGLLSVVVLLALWQRGAADGRLDQAMAKVAASRAEALRLADPVTARKLSLAAWRLAPIPEARRALTSADPAVDVFADPYAGPRSLHAISDDGSRLAALDEGTLRVYDIPSRRRLALTAGPAQTVRAMAWSPDGHTLALVGVDRSYLWDTTSGGGVGPPFGRGLGAPGEQSAWFSPGGGLLFAAARLSGERWAWDLKARRAAFVGEYAVVGPGDRVALVFAGRRSELRRPSRPSRAPWLDRMPWEYTTFAPDGGRVAIAEESGIQIYDLDGVPTRSTRLRPSPGHLRFSPDGRLLISTDSDRVRVWRLDDATGTPVADRAVPAAGVDRAAQATITGDGRRLRVLAGHGIVLTIDLAPGTAPRDHAAYICSRYGALSPQEWSRHLPELPHRDTC
ncbi:nSTAND1 domain-containing NTPase [Nonomuraea jabiensis]|uniref:nSTAND1 domain-containing NTPase n=1 Tax=Nonomuraea jabiensis TaxID=882448 RepID=UPI0036C5C00E